MQKDVHIDVVGQGDDNANIYVEPGKEAKS